MKYTELKKHLEEHCAQNIYLFEGEEAYFLENGPNLIASFLNVDKTMDYASFDGSTLKGDKWAEFTSSLFAFPFMSQKRLIRVNGLYLNEKEYASRLESYFASPCEQTVLVIVNSEKPKKDAVKLSSKPSVVTVDCSKADPETVKKWIYLTLKKQGIILDGVANTKVAEYCLFDMARISKETEKLICYANQKGLTTLSEADVDELIYPDSEYKIYELSNELQRGNRTGFIKVANELLEKGYDEMALLSNLSFHFKTMYEVSVMQGSNKEIAEALSMKEYPVKKHRELEQKLGKDKVRFLYGLLAQTTADIKSGKIEMATAYKNVVAKLFLEDI